MKVITIARAVNEERNIERFCKTFSWVDTIIVSDGGSTDNTKKLAVQFPNVMITDFEEKIWSADKKFFRNPHGRHINSMIDLAEELKADWIIFEDVDCVPNYAIQEAGKALFEVDEDFIHINRVYVFGDYWYFERLTKPYGDFTPSMMAWRANKGFRADETDPMVHAFNRKLEPTKIYEPPYCRMHYFYPDVEWMKSKIEFYRGTGEQPQCQDPVKFGGRILPLEKWMKI